ncbi:hypothetical protein [uncultured Prevotella sp.]|uniref:putative polyvalent protein kinase domain-containing protein n=1 Tax=uncultured Prevotella sp. TaxID=159272 RepID=UPI0027E3A9AF|nr:hypothetical protein [uncultured Prevotella sp.]
MNYGRKVIKYILGKWANSTTVHYEAPSKVQADSDRSDIRVFETGISSQRHGDIRQSTRAVENEESLRLINIAKENGLYINKSDWDGFGSRRTTPTGESIVYLSNDGQTFTKFKSPFAKSAIKNISPKDIIYEHLIHNLLFPDTSYHFIGISEDIKGIRIVLRQKNVSCVFDIPSQKAIDNYLNKVLGLKKEDNYFYGNDYFSVTDVSNLSDNVLSGEDGHLYFIDPIIKLKKPALEVLDFLYKTKCK